MGRRGGLVAITAAFVIAMIGATLPTPLYVLYETQFGFSGLTSTVIFATYAAGVLLALLLFGGFSDQIGRRPVLIAGLVLSAVSAVCFLAAHSLPALLVGRLTSGVSAGLVTGTATAAIVDLMAPVHRARATLLATVANVGGLGSGPLVAGLIAHFTDEPLRLVFLFDLAIVAIAIIGVWMAPETVKIGPQMRLRPQRPRVPLHVRSDFATAALTGFTGFAVLSVFTAVAPAFYRDILGIRDPAVAGILVASVYLASAIGQTLIDRVSIRAALMAGTAALATGELVFAIGLLDARLWVLVAGGLLAGAGQGTSFRASIALVSSAAPAAQRAEITSAFFVVAYLAVALPVVGVGVLSQVTSLRTAGLSFAAMVAALALIGMTQLKRTSPVAPGVRR